MRGMDPSLIAAFKTVFVVVAALLPILNPPGAAPVFLARTHGASPGVRAVLARRIALNVFCMLVVAMFVGSFVLEFFGISLPVVRVAGGLLVCSTAWQLLTAADPQGTGDAALTGNSVSFDALSQRAFYPLTFPLTCGPGSIAVAITLGASLQSSKVALVNMASAVVGLLLNQGMGWPSQQARGRAWPRSTCDDPPAQQRRRLRFTECRSARTRR